MGAAPIPADEDARLGALYSYRILDTAEEPAFGRVAALAARALDVPIAIVSLVDANRNWHKACVGAKPGEVPREVSFCAHALGSAGPLVIPDATADPRTADNPFVTGEPHIRAYAGAPLVAAGGYVLGTLCALATEPRTFTAEQLETLALLAAVVVDELDLRVARERLGAALAQVAALATTDELTGIANHRAFRERLELLVAEGLRGRRAALAMIDVDHFKRFNDEHGHQEGDRVLAAVARVLGDRVRRTDLAARYGGEEFAVLFPDTPIAGALHVAEQLRAAIADLPDGVTASFGVADLQIGQDAEEWLAAADAALYAAKRAGRNRVSRGD